MYLARAALVLLLHAHICMISRSDLIQQEKLAKDCFGIADVALVVQTSGSIEGDGRLKGRFNKYVKPLLKALCKSLNVGPGKVHVGMVSYGNVGKVEFGLTSDINEITDKIDGVVYKGMGQNSNASGGINVMRTQLLSPKDPLYRRNVAHICIVISDGVSTNYQTKTIVDARAAHNQGIVMLVVATTTTVDLYEIMDMASPFETIEINSLEKGIKNGIFAASGTVAYVPDIAGLSVVADQLVKHFKKTVCNASCPMGNKATFCKSIERDTCSDAIIRGICCRTCQDLV